MTLTPEDAMGPAPLFPTICLGSIVHRTYEAQHVLSLLKATSAVVFDNMTVVIGDAMVTRARGRVAARFLNHHREDVLMTIDSDIVFEPADVVMVARAAHETGGIAAALYMCRAMRDNVPTSILPEGVKIAYGPGAPNYTLQPGDGAYLASGFMAISRPALQRIAATADWYHAGTEMEMVDVYDAPGDRGEIERVSGEHVYMSEDYNLCERARGAGVQLTLVPSVELGHIGAYEYRVHDMGWGGPITALQRDARTITTTFDSA